MFCRERKSAKECFEDSLSSSKYSAVLELIPPPACYRKPRWPWRSLGVKFLASISLVVKVLIHEILAPFEDGNATHFQILLTLFKQFTGDRLDCPRYGSHWEQVGFQGNDPATDLRGVGMLGLIHPLFLVSTPELFPFGAKAFQISLKVDQHFPFMVLSINLTRIAYDALLDGLLKK